ncbi:OadG family protein [Fusobacterium sp.]|uniref:OadG family protein n=1 Tax=Fusobacterium sp. TaxID=68766 RepID=UPI002609CF9B|nr:OadG family protein [Fusobacterium sp.]
MFTGSTMGIFESLIVSALGLSVVFTALAVLAIAIVLFSKIFSCLGIAEEKKTPKVVKPAEEDLSEEHCAVIVAAISEELRSVRGEYRVKSIKEIK